MFFMAVRMVFMERRWKSLPLQGWCTLVVLKVLSQEPYHLGETQFMIYPVGVSQEWINCEPLPEVVLHLKKQF